jgi:transposase InsO family protein
MQTHMQTSLIRHALQMALQNNCSKSNYLSRLDPDLWQPGMEDNPLLRQFLVFHSDRGSQYASRDYRAMLKENRILSSMSRKGNCYDNAPMESFFHTLKTEATDRLIKPTIAELKAWFFITLSPFTTGNVFILLWAIYLQLLLKRSFILLKK